MPPKKPSAKPAKRSTIVEIVELASSSPGRISRRSGAALEKELSMRAPSAPAPSAPAPSVGLPPTTKVQLPDPTPNRFTSTADAYSYAAEMSAPARAARRSLSGLLGAAPTVDDSRASTPHTTTPSIQLDRSTSSQPLSTEAVLMGLVSPPGVPASSLADDDPIVVRQAVKVAEALPSIAQALFLFANLHWSQIGFSHDAPKDGSVPLQQRGNFYVISGSSTERGGGKAASVPPSPGKPMILSPPPTPSKDFSGGISLGGDAGKENVLPTPPPHHPSHSPALSQQSGSSVIVLGSVPIDERLLGAVGNRCPFSVTRDHVEQAAALFSDRLRTDWTQLNAPRLCFLGQRNQSLSVPSTNALRAAMVARFGSTEVVAKKIVLVTSASLAEALRKQRGATTTGQNSATEAAQSRPATADLLASIRKSRADQTPLVGVEGMPSAGGKLSSRIGIHQDNTNNNTAAQPSSKNSSNMRLLLQSVSSALNAQAGGGGTIGSKRPRDESTQPNDPQSQSTTTSTPPSISASLLAALPQDKLQEVVSAASVDHMYSAHDLSKRLQRQINLERTMELFDLVCAIFGPTRTSMSGGRLLQQLATQNSNGDNKDTIKEQLSTLVRLGQQGSGLTATAGSLVDILAGAAAVASDAPVPTPPSSDEDLSDRLVVLNRPAVDRRALERAIDTSSM